MHAPPGRGPSDDVNFPRTAPERRRRPNTAARRPHQPFRAATCPRDGASSPGLRRSAPPLPALSARDGPCPEPRVPPADPQPGPAQLSPILPAPRAREKERDGAGRTHKALREAPPSRGPRAAVRAAPVPIREPPLETTPCSYSSETRPQFYLIVFFLSNSKRSSLGCYFLCRPITRLEDYGLPIPEICALNTHCAGVPGNPRGHRAGRC